MYFLHELLGGIGPSEERCGIFGWHRDIKGTAAEDAGVQVRVHEQRVRGGIVRNPRVQGVFPRVYWMQVAALLTGRLLDVAGPGQFPREISHGKRKEQAQNHSRGQGRGLNQFMHWRRGGDGKHQKRECPPLGFAGVGAADQEMQ